MTVKSIFHDSMDLKMKYKRQNNFKLSSNIFGRIWFSMRMFLFNVLSFGPMPAHIAFIMDGNRRYSKKHNSKEDTGHSAGFSSLTSTLQYCYELGVKYVTVYAFSIDNFKRKPDEVRSLMNLLKEKIDELLEETSVVNEYDIRVNFWGELNLLTEPVRLAAKKAMTVTGKNTGPVLSVCVAYTSTHEILHAVQESCANVNKMLAVRYSNECINSAEGLVSVADLEQHLYSVSCPEPDIVVRTSGESRLSNFLLWQTPYCHLQNPGALWPEFSLRHLVWSILQYQRAYSSLHAKRMRSKKKY
ncbi:dehydrodolichyl diphosphate synthase CPT3-like isoform X2 [Dioscorea cayenensis subsp. rotundata]|uniref:Alkyl transferase n=1 Tax=Dioscorea cayennensis subsp. rotundata TaxID=55577 RepID=A0AB40D2Q2_DIOCR|nr:dehydrodolichyl diphosphate synthase CPT3-like isoform X2 [Dioscorea cayenensis subsp. rotundata]